MATQDRTHRDDAADTRQKVGRWEWVALPEFGISCMKASFTPAAEESLLGAEILYTVDLEGAQGVRFRIYPLAGDDRTFLLAEATLAIRPYNGDRPRIRTALVLNGQHWQADLELVPPHSLSAPLVLGTLAYGPRFLLDFQAEALAGPPMSWPEPFDPDATKS